MHYQKHIFLCVNQKQNGKKCCFDGGGVAAFDYLKSRLMELGLHGPAKIRVSHSGCLGRCGMGPGLVVYPEGIWYRYTSNQDLDSIIEGHLINNQIVESLRMKPLE